MLSWSSEATVHRRLHRIIAARRRRITLPAAYLTALRPQAKEDDYYVVLAPAPAPAPDERQADDSTLAEAALLLRLKPAELSRALAFAQPLPVARIPTQEEAAAIVRGLCGLEIEGAIISNSDLQM